MEQLVKSLCASYPAIRFTSSSTFSWSPETQEVFYKAASSKDEHAWALLHETGHALLAHSSYEADIELLKLEVAAWEKAKELAKKFGLTIDENHMQDCLDTYRDWLYARSVCPTCSTKCLQQSNMVQYRCFNCHTTWRVSPSRFCRAYRTSKGITEPQALFHATEGQP